jgi:ketosteroid isomerase-like protein
MLGGLAGHPAQEDLGLIAGERWLVEWLLGGDGRSLFAVWRTRGILAEGMGQSNVEIVRRLYDAVARRDTETVLSIYHPEVVWDHTNNEQMAGLMGGRRVFRGHEGLREWSHDFYEAWDRVEAEIDELIEVDADRVLVVLNYRGRGRASGIEVAFTRMAGILTIDDGRIVRAVWFPHRDRALDAVGPASG